MKSATATPVPPLVLAALRFAVDGHAAACATALEHAHPREVEWMLEGGLGPLLHRAVGAVAARVPERLRERLLAADLTAKVLHANRIATLAEVANIASAHGIPVTVLKGMAIAPRYPAAHLRPMGDIDVLVARDAVTALEAHLLRRGYRPTEEFDADPAAHHGAALLHPELGVWVEVHRALFGRLAPASVFAAAQLATHRVPWEGGHAGVRRLDDATHLLYLAQAWTNDLSTYRVNVHPTGLAPLVDAAYLLHAIEGRFDCAAVAARPDAGMALGALYVLASYLHRHRIARVHPATLADLAATQRVVGGLQRRVLHAILDRHVVGARPWTHRWPMPVVGRYKPSWQWRKRFGARVRPARPSPSP
jgi:hypothetical protein